MAIIVASDQHLGYANSDKVAFNQFLDWLHLDSTITDLVLLGDVVDMWRRDASGVFLENHDTLDKIVSLMSSMKVHYVAGNHDFHVLNLQNDQSYHYPFTFVKTLSLTDGGKTCTFLHGYEFDPMQQEPFMEALCRTMSDGAGDFESGAWATLSRDWSDIHYFFSLIFRKRSIRRRMEELQVGPEMRLANTLSDVETRACASAQPTGLLVFGHTHHPFINNLENVANSGSWIKDAPLHNTYVRIEAGRPRLFEFGGSEITTRINCPPI